MKNCPSCKSTKWKKGNLGMRCGRCGFINSNQTCFITKNYGKFEDLEIEKTQEEGLTDDKIDNLLKL